ncbi:MAG: cbb3-type cytochrome c oxidase subunit I, partial [Candidatus Hydrogenedentes bacterium]|nr:cbb3-type cytochrome c oxidase subunit I [Candidatus Hydrogenedentota bacterium]
MQFKGLWTSLIVVVLGSFFVLSYFGRDIYRLAPPIPDRVVTQDGQVVFTAADIQDGQNVWQSTGGQQMGTVWGHGSYVAPDWSADYMHREAVWLLNFWAKDSFGAETYGALNAEQQAALRARLRQELRTNTYNAAANEIVVSPLRAQAIAAVGQHYKDLYGNAPELGDLREAYAMPTNAVRDPERRDKLAAFFFWAAWACVTNRPGSEITYTQNWPPDALVDNRPTGSAVGWSVISFVLLLAGVGALAWYYAVMNKHEHGAIELPERDPLLALQPTPSMKATLKYFWVVVALIVVQVAMGAVTAHYGVEGSGFYGIPLAEWLPYAVTRSWHMQLAVFWIATAWLATGLFMAPAVSGYEPRFQRAGVN